MKQPQKWNSSEACLLLELGLKYQIMSIQEIIPLTLNIILILEIDRLNYNKNTEPLQV